MATYEGSAMLLVLLVVLVGNAIGQGIYLLASSLKKECVLCIGTSK